MKQKTPEYLNSKDMNDLSELNEYYIKIRNEALNRYGVDLASTDNSRKIIVYCDTDGQFIPRFKRNGIDGILNENATELKTAKLSNTKSEASFQFHVMGDISHNQYIFVIMDDELKVIRKYKITKQNKVKMINDYLEQAKELYLQKFGGKVQKRDIIEIPEKFIKGILNE